MNNISHYILKDYENAIRLVLLVTYGCCLKCKYCFVPKDNGWMKEEAIFRSIDFLLTSSKRNLQLHFFGAEPLMMPFKIYKKIIPYAESMMRQKNKKIDFILTTNGILLDEKIIDFLKKHNFTLELSLDGLPFSQNLNRPQVGKDNSYNKIVKNLKIIFDSGVDNQVSMVISPQTAKYAYGNFCHLIDLGFKKIFIMTACGMRWPVKNLIQLKNGLSEISSFAKPLLGSKRIMLLNLKDWYSPFRMNTELGVDVNGYLFSAACLAYLIYDKNIRKKFSFGKISDIMGSIDYWDKLRTSNEKTMQVLYKEVKTLKSLSSNVRAGNIMVKFVILNEI